MGHIICINRQYASGGHEVGEHLAKALGIPFYDNELVSQCAKDSNLSRTLFKDSDEKPSNSLLYALATGNYMALADIGKPFDTPIRDKVFYIQADTIKGLAQKGPCVIVGRCAADILHERSDVCSVFVWAEHNFRKERAVQEYACPADKVEEALRRKDKERADYHNYFCEKKWNRADTYDLSVNSSAVGIQGAVDVILSYLKALDDKDCPSR